MGDENTKKRKIPWKTAYSKMPQKDVEERIGISIMQPAEEVITPEDMLFKAIYHYSCVAPLIWHHSYAMTFHSHSLYVQHNLSCLYRISRIALQSLETFTTRLARVRSLS